MTATDIEKAFNKAIESDAFKKLDLTKFDRSNLKRRPSSIGKKLEILFLLDKLILNEST